MNLSGSYQISSIANNIEGEINRLKAQVDLFWDNEWKHYQALGLANADTIIELGSGPGFLLEKLLTHIPQVKVTGVEIDPLLVNYATEYLKKEDQSRWQVHEGDIMQTGMKDNTYDFAITRLVLEHLPDPIKAMQEIYRIVKPGGKVIVVDNDFEMHIMTYPPVLGLRELYDAYCKARFAEGGNPKIGRELPHILKDGGFSDVQFNIISAHSTILGDEMFFQSEGVGIPYKLMQDGFLSSKDLGKISIGWRNMIQDEKHAIVRQLCLAVGEKSM
ncbi:methyltransferase domain-containing protein [Bacillus sp. XF8]|uniref:methyltransferase domain-containing protein n=1 Tax=Bacillus sp. XF8 TaxID=2819289 RepID=UPI001AA0A6B1|nr:methyltransferase domain-containing protein [Bacillus sp. XF8]MBO1580923.1 methyltransferase domain-containing protein [Bacillus sp. XF8]